MDTVTNKEWAVLVSLARYPYSPASIHEIGCELAYQGLARELWPTTNLTMWGGLDGRVVRGVVRRLERRGLVKHSDVAGRMGYYLPGEEALLSGHKLTEATKLPALWIIDDEDF